MSNEMEAIPCRFACVMRGRGLRSWGRVNSKPYGQGSSQVKNNKKMSKNKNFNLENKKMNLEKKNKTGET